LLDRANAGGAGGRCLAGPADGGCAPGCATRVHENGSQRLTGLALTRIFTATKLTWLAENDPAVWARVLDGSLAVGTWTRI